MHDSREKPTVVCSCFLKKEGKFLLVFDPKFKVWRVPGGRPEWGEKLEEALKREIWEELKIKIQTQKFLGWGQDVQYHYGHREDKSRVLMYFLAETDQEIQDKNLERREIENFKWVTLEELKKHENLENGMVDFLAKISDLKF